MKLTGQPDELDAMAREAARFMHAELSGLSSRPRCTCGAFVATAGLLCPRHQRYAEFKRAARIRRRLLDSGLYGESP